MAGGSAFLYGTSSGAALAMEAAIQLAGKVPALAMYEAPYDDDPASVQAWRAYRAKLRQAVAAGQPGDAVAHFMMLLKMPAKQVEGMRQAPFWPLMEAVGHTLEYDAAILGEESSVPTAKAGRVAAPALVMSGDDPAYPFMQVTARKLAGAMPNGRLRLLHGQTHDVAAEAVAPVLVEFFAGVGEGAEPAGTLEREAQ